MLVSEGEETYQGQLVSWIWRRRQQETSIWRVVFSSFAERERVGQCVMGTLGEGSIISNGAHISWHLKLLDTLYVLVVCFSDRPQPWRVISDILGRATDKYMLL